jgi:hypothetical protein
VSVEGIVLIQRVGRIGAPRQCSQPFLSFVEIFGKIGVQPNRFFYRGRCARRGNERFKA